jgi:type I restriction enzyme, R subunit
MDVSRLYETPYVDMSSMGPEGVFPSAEVAQIVALLELVQMRAVA